jgi:hypothetical protein
VSCGTLQVAHTHLWVGLGGVRLPVDEKEHQASSRAQRRGLKGCSLPIHPGGELVFRDLKVNAACGFRPVRAAGRLAGRPHPALLTLTPMLLEKEEKRSVSIAPGGWWVLGKPTAGCLARAKKLFYTGTLYMYSCNILCLRVQLLS